MNFLQKSKSRMSLLKKIGNQIESAMEEFCKLVSEKYDIKIQDLQEIYEGMNQFKGVSKTKKRVSAYMIYAKEARVNLLAKNPDLKFGEISKMIAKSWKNLSEDEKEKYKDKIETSKVEVPLVKKKIAELRKLCKEKHLNTKGSKKELIERLENEDKDSEITENDDDVSIKDDDVSIKDDDNSVKDDDNSVKDDDASFKEEDAMSLLTSSPSSSIRSESSVKKKKNNTKGMTVTELKKLCKEKGFSTKGNKKELMERLAS